MGNESSNTLASPNQALDITAVGSNDTNASNLTREDMLAASWHSACTCTRPWGAPCNVGCSHIREPGACQSTWGCAWSGARRLDFNESSNMPVSPSQALA